MDVSRADSSRGGRWSLGLIAVSLAAAVALPSTAFAGFQGGTPAGDCKPFASTPCLLPFPNDLPTNPPKARKPAVAVDLPKAPIPPTQAGAQRDVPPYDRNAGFTPGSSMVARGPALATPKA